jgi:methionine sulfoxide reductase heme-binding subunit
VSFLAKLIRSKLVAWFLILLPGLWSIRPLLPNASPSLQADPLKFILHHLGFSACVLLATVLAFTPLRVLAPKNEIVIALNRHRRLVGVSAAIYGLLHFTTHLIYEGSSSAASIVASIPHTLAVDVKKPFLITGMITLTILLVLAVTSLHAFVRWLGGRKWKNLHRLAYVAAALAAYHQAAARKVFPPQVLWIFVPLVVLELARIIKQRAKPRAGPPRATASRAAQTATNSP